MTPTPSELVFLVVIAFLIAIILEHILPASWMEKVL